MTTIEQIEKSCRTFSAQRDELAAAVATLQAAIETLKAQHLPGIRRALKKAAGTQHEILEQVSTAPEAFEKPKSVVFHGVKVGWRKGTGSVEWSDEAQTVALIKKHLKDRAEVLIKTTEKPIKAAIKELDVRDLARIGCVMGATGEEPFVAPVDGEVDKLVNALLKGALDAEAQAAA